MILCYTGMQKLMSTPINVREWRCLCGNVVKEKGLSFKKEDKFEAEWKELNKETEIDDRIRVAVVLNKFYKDNGRNINPTRGWSKGSLESLRKALSS